MSQLAVVTAQSAALEPEPFQSRLIENLSQALLREPSPPCLLHAPTGSGKTFMLARVLSNVSAARPTVWFWFVPFVNLVQQTEDQIASNCPTLTPALLKYARNQDPRSGTVMLSTAQAVARAKDRNAGFNADADDDTRSLAEFVARVRAQGLAIGLVVDEAHIGLDRGTEFGKFTRWLHPEFLVLATATPKDGRLDEFFEQSGTVGRVTFSVSRLETVEARLNKRYVEAVIYTLRKHIANVADLKTTVLRQAWLRHNLLKQQLEAAGVALTPLLLVQVGNGQGTIEEAERDLVRMCKVPPAMIGKHSADAPDPVLMAAIANDTTKEVLIFKQSAGTGFDAPRAFVLASTKTVNDPDFAMQFIGRVMRVAQPIRNAFPKPQPIPADLDTAYIYLADAQEQQGFESAVRTANAVRSQLEGQTEKLEARTMTSGAVVYTSRPTPQGPLIFTMPEQPEPARPLSVNDPDAPEKSLTDSGFQPSLLQSGPNTTLVTIDDPVPKPPAARATVAAPQSESELAALLEEKGLRAYRKKTGLPQLPRCLAREQRPEFADMGTASRQAATELELNDRLKQSAVRAATDGLHANEIHTELTGGKQESTIVEVITNRQMLARKAIALLKTISLVEDADVRIIVEALAECLEPEFRQAGITFDSENELRRHTRDAAYWVILSEIEQLRELVQKTVADAAIVVDAGPLPDALLFPSQLKLASSTRNIYGVMPPSAQDFARIGDLLGIDDQQTWIAERNLKLGSTDWLQAPFDGSWSFNQEELEFARALDAADFVAWWHRNPDRKKFSVGLVRGDHQNYFYPDFVVCITHEEGEPPLPRLIETKESTKDAARKARRIPRVYGKVLFVTNDAGRLRVVNDDGSLGQRVDEDLRTVQHWMEATRLVH